MRDNKDDQRRPPPLSRLETGIGQLLQPNIYAIPPRISQTLLTQHHSVSWVTESLIEWVNVCVCDIVCVCVCVCATLCLWAA